MLVGRETLQDARCPHDAAGAFLVKPKGALSCTQERSLREGLKPQQGLSILPEHVPQSRFKHISEFIGTITRNVQASGSRSLYGTQGRDYLIRTAGLDQFLHATEKRGTRIGNCCIVEECEIA